MPQILSSLERELRQVWAATHDLHQIMELLISAPMSQTLFFQQRRTLNYISGLSLTELYRWFQERPVLWTSDLQQLPRLPLPQYCLSANVAEIIADRLSPMAQQEKISLLTAAIHLFSIACHFLPPEAELRFNLMGSLSACIKKILSLDVTVFDRILNANFDPARIPAQFRMLYAMALQSEQLIIRYPSPFPRNVNIWLLWRLQQGTNQYAYHEWTNFSQAVRVGLTQTYPEFVRGIAPPPQLDASSQDLDVYLSAMGTHHIPFPQGSYIEMLSTWYSPRQYNSILGQSSVTFDSAIHGATVAEQLSDLSPQPNVKLLTESAHFLSTGIYLCNHEIDVFWSSLTRVIGKLLNAAPQVFDRLFEEFDPRRVPAEFRSLCAVAQHQLGRPGGNTYAWECLILQPHMQDYARNRWSELSAADQQILSTEYPEAVAGMNTPNLPYEKFPWVSRDDHLTYLERIGARLPPFLVTNLGANRAAMFSPRPYQRSGAHQAEVETPRNVAAGPGR